MKIILAIGLMITAVVFFVLGFYWGAEWQRYKDIDEFFDGPDCQE